MKYRLPSMFLAATVGVIAPVSEAQAAIFVFTANLDGPSEEPPVNSLGTGTATVTFDDLAHTMRVQATFSGLTGTTTVAHIHCCTPIPGAGNVGVATPTPTFPGFPSGVTGGSYDNTLDMTLASSYNPAFVTANGGTPANAEAALLLGMQSGRAYLNIHTNAFPSGEIRGFLQPVPEPLTMLGTATAIGFGVSFKRELNKKKGQKDSELA